MCILRGRSHVSVSRMLESLLCRGNCIIIALHMRKVTYLSTAQFLLPFIEKKVATISQLRKKKTEKTTTKPRKIGNCFNYMKDVVTKFHLFSSWIDFEDFITSRESLHTDGIHFCIVNWAFTQEGNTISFDKINEIHQRQTGTLLCSCLQATPKR